MGSLFGVSLFCHGNTETTEEFFIYIWVAFSGYDYVFATETLKPRNYHSSKRVALSGYDYVLPRKR